MTLLVENAQRIEQVKKFEEFETSIISEIAENMKQDGNPRHF